MVFKNVILSGGSGTRLWPISRNLMPKQFVKLFDNKSLFQLTLQRNAEIFDSHLIVSNSEQYFLADEQLNKPDNNIEFLLEPAARNTAPAIALAALAADPNDILFVSPSDHLIKNQVEYEKIIRSARGLADQGYLVTFGIKPNAPETGFGYIEYAGQNVKKFHEKPDIDTAKKYLHEGNYFWNSGMFMFKASSMLQELELYEPTIFRSSKKAFENSSRIKNIRKIQKNDMLNIPENSIDYAVMEKSSKVKIISADISWSDMGCFEALSRELPKDANQNTVNKNHIYLDSKNNFIYGDNKKIVTLNIEDLIIVDTGDALLITKKGQSQKIKSVVAELKKNTQLHNIHLTGFRPWGSYTVLEDKPGYKIKKLEVKPRKRLSLQSHKHRNEHWVIVSGTATITNNGQQFTLNENESTYIKAGDKHRIANDTDEPLIVIETQVGSYTGEDDIERFDDDFMRKKS